ncbi:4-hydroxy-3-methylbut-2-enyl diphosphate reductase [Brevifollis gellanilyticus]|uniref:4-hydroxy-3-methylbut-2-enyl diphosphate reductase n=1 Tax=Brevifollis gellanilyticus TaxID=748831 RepID=A0A512M387_9BACT|nr:4-hydroxy-3-methylbut-2-enyl diphosphate reductase [Brevifollis gellanilyticus]GEP41217.1 4-hydroxy-3-methylbut-2-enyl diphosphate reductase 2 [Brevifollis gellanilyticus]
MNLHLAQHHGMCFGVRDALRATHEAAKREPVTILGQLVHNPLVDAHLKTLGVRNGQLESTESASTQRVVITAHGAADTQREAWRSAGHAITDTTCPLVKKAHQALATLVQEGYHPIVIGQRQHVEVRGLVGDFPEATVVLEEVDTLQIPAAARFGVISQTTQPLDRVLELVSAIKRQHPRSEVRFVDTVCHPTKQRQTALEVLCHQCEVVIVIGGRNSNNTRQLTEKATRLGVRAHQVESPDDLREEWFTGIHEVGITAGTSTLDETVTAVMDRLRKMTPA